MWEEPPLRRVRVGEDIDDAGEAAWNGGRGTSTEEATSVLPSSVRTTRDRHFITLPISLRARTREGRGRCTFPASSCPCTHGEVSFLLRALSA